ncbi:hypothetical protein ABT300_34500 [Streptomyces sp. NPDC001027]|uniref:hypothetical protein n=1 Tax=Streptomyces sp. NPDC001027 TaxID=3154771 RepID=UPI00331DC16A
MTAYPACRSVRVDTTGRPGGEILLGVVDGRRDGDDPTFVVAQGFLAFVEPFEMQRFRLMAAVLRARLVVVETPGAGFAASRLLPEERRALLRGDFRAAARRMLRAATEITGSDGGTRGGPGVLGYSLGASFAAAMAAVSGTPETGPPVETVVLVEPVAVQRWSAAALVAAVRRENRLIGPCLAETATVAGSVPPLEARTDAAPRTLRRTDLLLLANALRAGRLSDDLGAAVRRPVRGTRRLVVVRGEQSDLSPRRAVHNLVTAAAEGPGIEARLLTVPGPHAFWHSLSAVGSATTNLAHELRTPPS